ncbi:MAG: exodeoxyribonuclease VII small subunit [Bacteroidales bacterium]|nr:exodeoxyribonuclease VII small subunit [Candidatus Physcousia equi]
MTYEESIQKLESIVLQMEQGEMPIDALANRLAEANKLIAECRSKLLLADQEVQETLNANETK